MIDFIKKSTIFSTHVESLMYLECTKTMTNFVWDN